MPFYILEAHKKPYEKFADRSVQEIKVPYDIPENWEWVKVGNICTTNIGLTFKPSEVQETGIPIYKANNIKNGKISTLDLAFVSEKTIIKENEWLNKNDILMAVRSGSKQLVGKTAIVENLKTKTSFGAFMSVIRPISISSTFMNYFFQSSHFRSQLDDANTTTIFQVTQKMLKETLLPLPPLAEQKRIVAQIERALKKVEIYAESYNQLQKLDKIFPDKLKKSILQYAMQGKLVEQDPNDESVEVLLETIRAEKQKLFEEGKIKKKDLEISIVSQGDDNSYYGNVPMNWVVIKIKDIFSINTGLSYKKGDLSINNKGVRIIRGGNIKPLEFSLLDNDYYIDTQFISSEQVYLKRNQLITPVSTSLEHIGKFARIDKDYDGVVAGGFIFQLTPFESSEIISKFLLFNLSSPLFYKQLKAITKLSGQALYNIPKTTLSELLIPLAPFEEQELITQKVEKLFEKVNQL